MKKGFKTIISGILALILAGTAGPQAYAQTFHETDSLCRVVEEISLSQARQAYKMLDSLQKCPSTGCDSLLLQSRILLARAATDFAQGNSDSLLSGHIRQKLAASTNTGKDAAMLHLALAYNHTGQQQYAQAFQAALKAAEIFRNLPPGEASPYLTGKAYSVLGNVCTLIKSYNMAERYYGQELLLTETASFEHYQALLNLSKIYFYTQPLPSSIDTLSKLIPKLIEYKEPGLLSIAYLNLAACFIMQDKFDTAGIYYARTLALNPEVDNPKLRFSLYQGLGSYYFYIQDMKRSFAYFNLSKELALKNQNLEFLSYVTYNLGLVCKEAGMTDSALSYMMEHIEINNLLDRNSNAIETYQAYASALLESSENKLTIAQQNIELKNRNMALIALSATGILLVGALSFAFFYRKKRQQALIKDMEKKELENKLENEHRLKLLQAKRHQEKMEAKAREIASYALLVSNKNQVLQQIANLAKEIGNPPSQIGKIESIIKSNMNTEAAWEDFMLHFQKIHPKFFQKLKSYHGAKKLTENELRLCAYFRIGMSAKQIAQILNVSPEAIRIHRYRLKKKLMLGEEENIDDFIRNV